jgi:hypothetical protein
VGHQLLLAYKAALACGSIARGDCSHGGRSSVEEIPEVLPYTNPADRFAGIAVSDRIARSGINSYGAQLKRERLTAGSELCRIRQSARR